MARTKLKGVRLQAFLFFSFLIFWPHSGGADNTDRSVTPIALPDGSGGIGFDDLTYAPFFKKVLVPGGRTGNLYLVDSTTHKVQTIPGFSSEKEYFGEHDQSITSADEGENLIFVADRTARSLNAADPYFNKIVISTKLAGHPDYVRYISDVHEVWVTEPDNERIEVFKQLSLSQAGFIAIPGGPESLVYDSKRQRAYTHLWAGQTLEIDVKTRKVTATWPNGCNESRGIALDSEWGFLFAGCAEGRGSVLDLNRQGALVGSLKVESGIDGIGYNPKLKHLYLPSSENAILTIAQVSKDGQLKRLRDIKTEKHSHCTVSDNSNGVWVCAPDQGKLLFFNDQG